MDKKTSHKEEKISPTLLTPCRAIGLRRKRSGFKNASSPSLNLSCASDITSPSTPLNTSSFKAHIISARIAPSGNVEHYEEAGVKTNINNVEARKQTSIKRRSTTPFRSSILRRKLICTHTDDGAATSNNSTKNETLFDDDEKSSLVKNEERNKCTINASKDHDTAKSSDADVPHLYSANGSSCINVGQSANKKLITASEISALRERIASKEKKLRELQLAALYKKKHDHKQVAKEIDSWLQGCKEALNDLQSELAKRGQSYSLTQLLKTLRIPPSLIDIDDDDDS